MESKKIRTLIVDDEQEGRDLLFNLLKNREEIEIIDCCENAIKALVSITSYLPDLVFLDIQMPLKNGFELLEDLEKLKITHPEFVFVTAYDQYAVKAIQNSAFDFLLKPIDISELDKTINKFLIKEKKNNFLHKIEVLFENLSINKKLKFNTRTGFITINPNDIIFCVAEGNYTMLSLVKSKTELLTNSMGQVEFILPGNIFFRINRSHIINVNYLVSVNRKTKTCTLKHDNYHKELLISSEKIKDLENLF